MRVYACGIPPYEGTHVGHAATYVWVDTALRVLHCLGLRAELCRNVTDVDDTLTAAAAQRDTPYDELAAVQQFDFERQMAALGVARPTHEPRAHNYISQVIALASGLLAGDHAYVRDGSVYFRGASVTTAAGLDPEQAQELVRAAGDDPEDGRDDPADTPVWRSSRGRDAPGWPSPWGRGRPGWHAECTAMALSTFGSSVDLHAGGEDLRFPHHAYEAAMAEAFTGVAPFSRAWLHVGEVRVAGEKMSKSAGNCVRIAELLAAFPAPALRLALINRPFSAPWDFSTAAVDDSADLIERLGAASRRPGSAAGADEVRRRLAAGLDVPGALSLAIEAGGPAAELVSTVLGLDQGSR